MRFKLTEMLSWDPFVVGIIRKNAFLSQVTCILWVLLMSGFMVSIMSLDPSLLHANPILALSDADLRCASTAHPESFLDELNLVLVQQYWG